MLLKVEDGEKTWGSPRGFPETPKTETVSNEPS